MTNDPKLVNMTNVSSPVFSILDFPYVQEIMSSSVPVMLVEQLVAMRAKRYIPSVPTSITEAVLRLRLNEYDFRQDDVELRAVYEQQMELIRERRRELVVLRQQ